jgi:hypothetical protein
MGSFKGDNTTRRVDRAVHHVSKPWFPMNPTAIKNLRDGFAQRRYDQQPELLLEDLKADFSLFTFVVKELTDRAVTSEDGKHYLGNPIKLLRWGGVPAIKEILSEHHKLPNFHSLHWSEPFQIQRLRETMIVASTASVLSERNNLDPELGFSRGVIRDLGLNLIAWNYPTVYTKVLSNLTASQNLDEELAKELGFTPALLSTRIFRPDWAGDPELQDQEDNTWASYDDLCMIGEILARAESPSTYPSAAQDYPRAERFIHSILGDEGMDLIRRKAAKISGGYKIALPEVFADIGSFDPGARIRENRKLKRQIDPRALRYCSDALKRTIEEIYSQLSDETINRDIVGRILKDVVSSAGFSGGCIFMVDPLTLALKPRTLIGKVELRKIIAKDLEPSDPAVSALSIKEPVLQMGRLRDSDDGTAFYSVLGERKKIGVLYLESPKASASFNSSEQALGVFSALKQLLSDALMLE